MHSHRLFLILNYYLFFVSPASEIEVALFSWHLGGGPRCLCLWIVSSLCIRTLTIGDEKFVSLSFAFEEVGFGAQGYFGLGLWVIILIIFECVGVDDVNLLFLGLEEWGFGSLPAVGIPLLTIFSVLIGSLDVLLLLNFSNLNKKDDLLY